MATGTRIVNFRVGVLEEPLSRRANALPATPSAIAKRDLERYYAFLADEIGGLDISEPEWNLLREVCGGTAWDVSSYGYLWAEIEESCRDGLDQKWGVDGASLVQRVREYGLAGAIAIIDAVELWRGEQRKREEG